MGRSCAVEKNKVCKIHHTNGIPMCNKWQQVTGNELCMKVGEGLNLNDAAYFASQSVKVPPSNHLNLYQTQRSLKHQHCGWLAEGIILKPPNVSGWWTIAIVGETGFELFIIYLSRLIHVLRYLPGVPVVSEHRVDLIWCNQFNPPKDRIRLMMMRFHDDSIDHLGDYDDYGWWWLWFYWSPTWNDDYLLVIPCGDNHETRKTDSQDADEIAPRL